MESLLSLPEIVRGFETALASILMKLDHLHNRQDTILNKLSEIDEKTRKNTKVFEDQERALMACQIAFVQVRDACHVLREELSEAAGTMIQESWNM